MLVLACDNALQDGATRFSAVAALARLSPETVGDLAPLGVVAATAALALAGPHRALKTTDRVLVLVLGTLVAMLAASLLGLKFGVSPLGVATLPLLAASLVWLEGRARSARPHRLAERVWPIELAGSYKD